MGIAGSNSTKGQGHGAPRRPRLGRKALVPRRRARVPPTVPRSQAAQAGAGPPPRAPWPGGPGGRGTVPRGPAERGSPQVGGAPGFEPALEGNAESVRLNASSQTPPGAGAQCTPSPARETRPTSATPPAPTPAPTPPTAQIYPIPPTPGLVPPAAHRRARTRPGPSPPRRSAPARLPRPQPRPQPRCHSRFPLLSG